MEDAKVKLSVFFYWAPPYFGGRLSQGSQDSLFQLDLLADKPLGSCLLLSVLGLEMCTIQLVPGFLP